MSRNLYIKPNQKKYKGFWGPNGYYSFEYGYINDDGSLEPAGKEADVIDFTFPVSCDFVDKTTMRIMNTKDCELEWMHHGNSNATVIHKSDLERYSWLNKTRKEENECN